MISDNTTRKSYLIIDPFAPTSKRYLFLREKSYIDDGGFPASEYICYDSETNQIVRIFSASVSGRTCIETGNISPSLESTLRELYKDEIAEEESEIYTSKW
jgi:hypothetical protein